MNVLEYELSKNTLFYNCPACSAELRSKITEGGKSDQCPECSEEFVVPGEAERKRYQETQLVVEQNRRRQRETKAARKQNPATTRQGQRQVEEPPAESHTVYYLEQINKRLADIRLLMLIFFVAWVLLPLLGSCIWWAFWSRLMASR